MVRSAAERQAVAHLRSVVEMSERRAYPIVSADRKMIRYAASSSQQAQYLQYYPTRS